MKTGVYIMMFALLLTGCNDFLKETSQMRSVLPR